MDDFSILECGLAKWRAEGRVLEAGEVRRPVQSLPPKAERNDVRNMTEMMANLASKVEQVVDARGPARFTGAEPETRPGLASGHIPGAVNLPYTRLFHADGTWKRGPDRKSPSLNS